VRSAGIELGTFRTESRALSSFRHPCSLNDEYGDDFGDVDDDDGDAGGDHGDDDSGCGGGGKICLA